MPHPEATFPELSVCLTRQRTAWQASPYPSLPERLADLECLRQLITEHETELVQAVEADFGCRSPFEIRGTEWLMLQQELRHTRRQLGRWMRRQRRPVDQRLFPSCRAWVQPQPIGVVGVLVPWNFPLLLALSPLIAILAAGNRAMLKLSERSTALAKVLQEQLPAYFSEDKVRVFADEPGLGAAFSALPFDHLFFTGSAATGRLVMQAAAAHLTPVTLELGGKSPAILAADFPLKTAVDRILWAKMLNAGQICTSVDHVYVPADHLSAFEQAMCQLAARRYPLLQSPDYTALIDSRAYQRQLDLLEDAKRKGARLVNLMPGQDPDPASHKCPPYLLFDVTSEMRVMQEEIFGPLLPVIPYQQHTEVQARILAQPRPLALYPFTQNARLQRDYIEKVMSGGVCLNQTLLQVSQPHLPFGGSGASGMGHYHGQEGFLTFSKLRPVFVQGPFDSLTLLRPPYGPLKRQLLNWILKWLG